MCASFNLENDLTSYVEREWRSKHEWTFESDLLPTMEEEGNMNGPLSQIGNTNLNQFDQTHALAIEKHLGELVH